jgi:hypothetical protein
MTRPIVAESEGTRTPDDADSTVRRIPLSQITADPGQPR